MNRMKIESTGFTHSDLSAFASDFMEHERRILADRLEADSARLAGLVNAASAQAAPGSGSAGWTAHEILAHVAVFSKFYGMLAHKIGTGQIHEVDLLGNVQQRDVVGQEMAASSTAQLLEIIQISHRRTVDYLRSADAAAMQRRADMGGGLSVSVDQIARLFLVAHLEQHLEQLELESAAAPRR